VTEIHHILSEPDCCRMPRDGHHAVDCPLALGAACDDCGAPAGVACFPFCASLLDEDEYEDGAAPAPEVWLPFLAVLEVDPGADFIRWNWIIGLCRPLVERGLIAAYCRIDGIEPVPLAAPANSLQRYFGWIDTRGLALTDRNSGLPAAAVLAWRAHRDAILTSSTPSGAEVALPVKLRLPDPVAASGERCACGHDHVEHTGDGFGCAMGRPHGLWCGCLSFRPAARRGEPADRSSCSRMFALALSKTRRDPTDVTVLGPLSLRPRRARPNGTRCR
jgi:hypothetical protein